MSRPGFVLEVDGQTPTLLTFAGDRVALGRFGVGTKVVYPSDATPSADPVRLIDAALEAPVGTAALEARLKPSTKLTLVVLDHERPRPRMRFDVRRTMVERVLEVAARVGVDDVAIVIGGGLNKRWSPVDMTRVLGDRVATSFQPDGRIVSHDITEPGVRIGQVGSHPVAINRRVAESDLVVSIGAQFGHDERHPLTTGIVDVATLSRLGAPGTEASFADGVCELVHDTTEIFALQAVLGQPLLSGALRFATRREWEWKLADKVAFAATRQLMAAWPKPAAQALHATPVADYAVVDVVGGDPGNVFAEAAHVWQAANGVEVDGQADVVVTGVWGGAFDDGDPVGSPINAAAHALSRRAGSHLGTPFAREGGAFIGFHPLRPRFSTRRQSSAADFFAKVLPETIDPQEMAEHEARACADEWYIDLYRKQFADHPLRTFQTWYRVARASRWYSDVIWVGGNRRTADLFGHRAATTYADALEIASNTVGRSPAITYLHGPGLPLGDVR